MEVLHINQNEFEDTLKSGKVVLVDFFATWCGPCRMLAPVLEEVRKELDENFVIAKVDVDENEKLAKQFGVMSIPTMIIFKNGLEVQKFVGLKTKSSILEALKNQLD